MIWDGEELRAPFSMTLLGNGELLVLDADALHAVSPEGRDVRRIGGSGEGPGEFALVSAGGPTPAGGAVIVDGRLRRASYLNSDGEYVRGVTLGSPPGLGSVVGGSAIAVSDREMAVVWTFGAVATDGPRATTALALHDSTGAPRTLATWEGLDWVDSPWVPMVNGPAGGEPPFALSRVDRTAYWAPHDDPCIHRVRLSDDDPLDPICPPFPSVRMEPYVPTEQELDEAGISGLQADVLTGKHEVQTFSGAHPPVQRLLADELGCIWVRIVKEDAPYDPMLEFQLPETRPPSYEWWVIDPDQGDVTARVLIPDDVRPRLVLADAVVGFIEQRDRTLSVARMAIERDGWAGCT